MRTKLILLVATLIAAAASNPAAAETITIKGKDFYRDGKPWVAKGIDVNAFVKPPKFFARPHAKSPGAPGPSLPG